MIALSQASRTDPTSGIREIAEYFGHEERMFGFTHLPREDARAGVVVCSPLYAEFNRNYRREVIIGRHLASMGVAVQRFHYRGHGNSDGRIREATYDAMRADALAAANMLIERAGTDRLAFFGTRFGALLAASTSAAFPGAPLALWDPVFDGQQYLRDIARAQRIQALGANRGKSPAPGLLEELEKAGAIHVLGYTITHALYASSSDHNLIDELGSSGRRILIVRLGSDPRLDRRTSEAIAGWRAADFEVDHRSMGAQEAWWFTAGALVVKEALTEPVDVTVEWLFRTLTEKEARP